MKKSPATNVGASMSPKRKVICISTENPRDGLIFISGHWHISSLLNLPKGTNTYRRSDFAYGFMPPKVPDLKK
jgi:hypothetical protein